MFLEAWKKIFNEIENEINIDFINQIKKNLILKIFHSYSGQIFKKLKNKLTKKTTIHLRQKLKANIS